MKKPSITATDPRHMHIDMQLWANSLDKPVLRVSVVFYDGSVYADTFARATREVSYKVGGELYVVDVDTSKFLADWLPGCDGPISVKKLKEAFGAWVKLDADVKSITWRYGKA